MDRVRKVFSIKSFLIAFGLLLFDLIVYLFLGLMLMGYDDFYDESKGAYWNLDSMSFWQKVNYIGVNVWHLINMIVIGFVIYRLVKAIRNKSLS